MVHLLRYQPFTMKELKLIVEEFAGNMKQEDVRKMAGNVEKRAELCWDQRSRHFKHLM